jgi:uncharacterized surface protein with fasciclin (FAS1) repeats
MTDILKTILYTRELSIFSTAIKTTNLDRVLAGNCDLTIFAPNNVAFGQLSKVNLDFLTTDVWQLTEIVSSHIIPGRFSYQDLLNMRPPGQYKLMLTAIDSSQVQIKLNDGIRFGTAVVLSTDKSASNGIVYIVDRVASPICQK